MKRVLTIWAALGAVYVALEILFRGRSHPAMLVVGGLCGVLVGAINQRPGFYRAPVIVQAVIALQDDVSVAGQFYIPLFFHSLVRPFVPY